MKLTSELLLSAPSYLNATKDRELLLRGHKIPLIENLGVTKDLSDAIDFTDNDIQVLGNFPKLRRLKTLLVARNRISHIQTDLASFLPNIESLILTSNNISQLADLDPLSQFKKLTYVSLLENPVTSRENYRLYVIWRNPHIRILDFTKVKDLERQRANTLFGTFDDPTPLASQTMGKKSRVFDASVKGEKKLGPKLTTEDKNKLREALKNATSLAEIEKIEQALSSGYL
jgi:U2 small nuclear ribonucleoprotein A'